VQMRDAVNTGTHVVDVNSLKQFETRLDKFWRKQDVMFGTVYRIM